MVARSSDDEDVLHNHSARRQFLHVSAWWKYSLKPTSLGPSGAGLSWAAGLPGRAARPRASRVPPTRPEMRHRAPALAPLFSRRYPLTPRSESAAVIHHAFVRYRTEVWQCFFVGTNVSRPRFCGRSRRTATDAAFPYVPLPPAAFFLERMVGSMRRERERIDKATAGKKVRGNPQDRKRNHCGFREGKKGKERAPA